MPLLETLLYPALKGAASYAGSKGIEALMNNFGGGSSGRAPTQQQQQNMTSSPGSFLTGRVGEFQQVPRYNQQQQNAFNQLLRMGLEGMNNPEAGFAPYAAQARQQFQSQTVPSLAERFTAGTGGRISSPAFASQLGSAGSQLESALATGAANYGLQNRNNLLQMLSMGLTPQFDTYQVPGQPGLLENLTGAIGPLAQLLPYLGRLSAEYKQQNLGKGEELSPFWRALLQATGGSLGQGK